MSKGKTEFKFQVNADTSVISTVIRNWLTVNKFKFEPKEGANYYAFNDPLLKGKRGFEFYIRGNEVTILAYLGTYKKPKALEGFVGAVMKQDYRNELMPLFEELKKLENGTPANMTAAAAYTQETPVQNAPTQDSSLNTFMDQNNKKQETMVIIGFIISLVGIIAAFFGVTYGAILLVIEYYLAIQGLKSKKRGLAIATIVLASVGVAINILNLVVYVLWAL